MGKVKSLMMDLQEEFKLTILFIAHDLSVVKHISSHIGVMYLGDLVESENSDTIFKSPQHDYTKKLLKAILKSSYFRKSRYRILVFCVHIIYDRWLAFP